MAVVYLCGRVVASDGSIGSAGAGKDEVATYLQRRYSYQPVALADDIKRIVHRVYGMHPSVLWGPSRMREEPDTRYERSPAAGQLEATYLTARIACQRFGKAGRDAWVDTWSAKTQEVIDALTTPDGEGLYAEYEPIIGAIPASSRTPAAGVVVSDLRALSEYLWARRHGARVLRVTRPVHVLYTSNEDVSERDMSFRPDSDFDAVLHNDGTLRELFDKVDEVMRSFGHV